MIFTRVFAHNNQNSLCAWWNPAPSDSEMAIFGPWTFAISADRFQKQRQERFSNVSLLQKWKIYVNISFEIVLIAWQCDIIIRIINSKSISAKYRLDRIKYVPTESLRMATAITNKLSYKTNRYLHTLLELTASRYIYNDYERSCSFVII